MEQPLVTVICLCHNQERFVGDALVSVFQQTYPSIELIVVDNGSTDESIAKIEATLEFIPHSTLIKLENSGSPGVAFNTAITQAQGKYIVNFSADTLLISNRIEAQVNAFSTLDSRFGAVFTDAEFIHDNLEHAGFWIDKDAKNQPTVIPSGNVYKALFRQNFIYPATLMIRKSVWNECNGYDETIAYPEFDFLVRSARKYHYYYHDEALTKVRKVPLQKLTLAHLQSVLKACQSAYRQNSFDKENTILANFLRQYLHYATFTNHHQVAPEFGHLLERITELTRKDLFWLSLAKSKVPLSLFYRSSAHLSDQKVVL